MLPTIESFRRECQVNLAAAKTDYRAAGKSQKKQREASARMNKWRLASESLLAAAAAIEVAEKA